MGPRTYRDYMANHPEDNLGWCRPYILRRDGAILVIAINEDGISRSDRDKMIELWGTDDMNDLDHAELGCAECPHYALCDAMDEDYGD